MLASPHPQPPTFPQNSKGWHVKKVAQLCLGVSLTSMCESESLQTIAVFARLQKKKTCIKHFSPSLWPLCHLALRKWDWRAYTYEDFCCLFHSHPLSRIKCRSQQTCHPFPSRTKSFTAFDFFRSLVFLLTVSLYPFISPHMPKALRCTLDWNRDILEWNFEGITDDVWGILRRKTKKRKTTLKQQREMSHHDVQIHPSIFYIAYRVRGHEEREPISYNFRQKTHRKKKSCKKKSLLIVRYWKQSVF